ncbi:hypothetical protein DC522_05800 [Microvirga sp. KLBC 81]|uniref:hypothetical protein n=1 Tax=Microvirga sp. KLBC 81 TaxID=1862707 RepID=UPI000D51DA18|nr:hypothetical protein [Microvirga sp. KLBC 81]PVE25408.1 hypothetical protein DC522_05800 [Microvirga sp. KLBC 81]
MSDKAQFEKEADLCSAFIEAATKGGTWKAYPETAGFDILLVRNDGVQIGVEAKLALNAKVLAQILPGHINYSYASTGPDYRAVLVPAGKDGALRSVCAALGITVITCRHEQPGDRWYRIYGPELPNTRYVDSSDWHEWAPMKRCDVPDYVPDVSAGVASPVSLSAWKVKAIKLAIILEERPVTRADFKALQLSPTRWTDPYTGWLRKTDEGYVPGPHMPDFKAQHPRNYEEIKADRDRWMPGAIPMVTRPKQGQQEALL